MKYVLNENCRKELGYYNNKKIPVFESRDEFIRFFYYRNSVNFSKEAQKLKKKATKEEIGTYGENEVLYRCYDEVERRVSDKQAHIQNKMLEKAKEMQGDYFGLTEERIVKFRETCLISHGYCVSEEIAKECVETYRDNHYRKLNIVDKDGNNLKDKDGNNLEEEDEISL